VKYHDPADGASGRSPELDAVSQLEGRLRAAFRARASEVRTPTPPLDLTPPPARHGVLADGHGGARTLATTRWLVSVGAAMAMLAIIVGALAVADALAGHPAPQAGPIQTGVPPYYVALVAGRPRSDYPSAAFVATVRATSTGVILATVRAPRPYAFASVTAAPDDRTFVVLAVGPFNRARPVRPFTRTYAQRFFELRIDPAAPTPSARAELTPLSQADFASGLQVQAMALSPNGQSLATILADPSHMIGSVTPEQLTIFNLATGGQQTWTRDVCAYSRCAQGPIGDGLPLAQDPNRVQLSWTSNGRSLLFIAGPTGSQVRLLQVDAPGSNLTGDSHALPVSTAIQIWNEAVITPDGKSVFIQYGSLTGSAERGNLLRFSASTGKATMVNQVVTWLGGEPTGSGPDYVVWTNDDGSTFIVLGARPGPIKAAPGQLTATPSGQTAGIYAGSRYAPLPWPAGVVDAAW
jgi:hypothetical protein